MSIKGMDSQIMVTRTAEYAKDISSQIKRGELTQSHLTAQAAVHEAVEKIKVPTPQEAQEAELHLNEDGGSSSPEEQSKKERAEEAEKEDETKVTSINYVPPGNNIIDIKV